MEQKIYKTGDVVWVLASKRLGWWPGRVENVEQLRRDLVGDVTDKTIAVVKYLSEDSYNFVEDEAIIRAYESDQKREYISVGMSKYRHVTVLCVYCQCHFEFFPQTIVVLPHFLTNFF